MTSFEKRLEGALAGASFAFLAGKFPPLTFLPEEGVTIPLFAGAGFALGGEIFKLPQRAIKVFSDAVSDPFSQDEDESDYEDSY